MTSEDALAGTAMSFGRVQKRKGRDMDFVQLTRGEYIRILIGRILVSPIKEPLWGNRRVLLLCLLPYIGLLTQGIPRWLDAINPIVVIVLLPVLTALFLGVALTVLSIIFLLPNSIAKHRKFISYVKHLDSKKNAMLLSEYPEARRIYIYYDKKNKILGTETIYVTKNFLFVPGFFLVCWDDIEEVFVHGPTRTGTTVFVFLLKNKLESDLEVYYRFRISPGTAEQVMSWFWQCDPSDPALPEKTISWYKDNTWTKYLRKKQSM